MSQAATQWQADTALSGFDATTFDLGHDYEGHVIATLIRRTAPHPTQKAVLYIHGYTDYFFQTHLAETFNAQGFNFYALDLRKYGRSLTADQHPNFCKDIEEYFTEISAAIRIITEEDGNETLVLKGHSTGGLTSSLYANSGEYRDRLDAVILNSPFFDWYLPQGQKRLINIASQFAFLLPYYVLVHEEHPSPYMLSIYADQKGEWDMNPAWRPLNGFPVYAGWCKAINKAHAKVRAGLNIQCPVLVMSSDKSTNGSEWRPEFQAADTILDVDHIREGSKRMGKHATYVQIPDGLHDLFLSREDVREHAASEIFNWLEKIQVTTPKVEA